MRWGKLASWALGVIGAALVAGSQVSATQATSNLGSWLKLVGIDHLPALILGQHIDTFALVVGLITIILAVVVAVRSWFAIRRMKRDYLTLWCRSVQLGQPRTVQQSPLELSIGEGGQFLKTAGHLYRVERTFHLQVSNTSADRTIRHIRVHLRTISPPNGYHGPWLLAEEFGLSAGDHKLLPLVTYGEAREPDKFDGSD